MMIVEPSGASSMSCLTDNWRSVYVHGRVVSPWVVCTEGGEKSKMLVLEDAVKDGEVVGVLLDEPAWVLSVSKDSGGRCKTITHQRPCSRVDLAHGLVLFACGLGCDCYASTAL